MKKKIKILFVASEVAPFAKVGGLADVTGSLPKALYQLGCDVRIICPRYETIRLNELGAKKLFNFSLSFLRKQYLCRIYSAKLPGSLVPAYLLEEPTLLSKGPIYGKGAEWKNLYTNRFLFFCRAVIEAGKKIKFHPQIYHLHDWPTAALCLLLNATAQSKPEIKTLLSIHNINNQNYANDKTLANFGLDATQFSPLNKSKTNPGYFNLFGQSLLCADAVNTVSPTYAKEIYRKKFGLGLEKILKKRKRPVLGILNGIDTEYFNPEKDKYIKQPFTARSLDKRPMNKPDLQDAFGLKNDPTRFICGVVTRLSRQKGLELIVRAISALIAEGAGAMCQFVILGEGEEEYRQHLWALQQNYPDTVRIVYGYDSHLARKIYAGSDVFLMPSKFEPCGLAQLIAMRYGAIPIVHDTGGLHDTVIDWRKKNGYGFVFDRFSSVSLLVALKTAHKLFQFPKIWAALQKKAMSADFSWKRSARAYLSIYKKLNAQRTYDTN